jgi:hypothetical protein
MLTVKRMLLTLEERISGKIVTSKKQFEIAFTGAEADMFGSR